MKIPILIPFFLFLLALRLHLSSQERKLSELHSSARHHDEKDQQPEKHRDLHRCPATDSAVAGGLKRVHGDWQRSSVTERQLEVLCRDGFLSSLEKMATRLLPTPVTASAFASSIS